MEDENGVELSLGLSCGGSSIKSKVRITSSSAGNAEQSDRGNKLVDDFKNFIHKENRRQDSDMAPLQSNMISSKDNFFNDLSKVVADRDSSMDLKRKGTWIESGNQYAETEGENLSGSSNTRKFLFEELNRQKKRERESHHGDLVEKTRTSRVSTTEGGSTAENEDAVESRAEGSTPRLVSKHDDGSKRGTGSTGSPNVSKEICRLSDSSAVDLSGQKRFNSSTIGAPISIQTMNIQNLPYAFSVKGSSTIGAPSTSGNLQLGMQHVLSTVNSEQSGAEHVNPRNLPLMAGVSPLQISAMDKDKSRHLVSQPQISHHSYVGASSTSSGMLYNGRPVEHTNSNGKQPALEEGSSSRPERMKGVNTHFNPQDASKRSKLAGISIDFPAIKPGIAAEVEFGGCGSYPNLPWVSATGPGSAGKTISGVTYRYSANQIKIVCACHGSHMSPEEFVRHAGEDDINAQNDNSSTSKNSAASAQS